MTGRTCSLCKKRFRDAEAVVDLVEGEFEADTGGMAAHGSLGRYHRDCWEKGTSHIANR